MKETRVAQRYAKSLISLAEERQVLEQVKEDMVIIKSVCKENRNLYNLLKSPVVKTDKKSAILKEIFAKELSELSLTFLNIITKKKREATLSAIANNFIDLYNKSKNIITARVTTAVVMTEDIRKEVLSRLKSIVGDVNVQVEERVDEAILGGFIIRVGDREFNASASNKLQKLKREFLSNPYIKEY